MHHGDAHLHMPRITFTADETHERIVDDVEGEDGVDSRSAAVRECITRYADLHHRVEELQQTVSERDEEIAALRDRLDSREERIDDLEEQLARRSQIEEKVDVLAERVEESQLTYAEKRQRMIDRASVAERLRWKVTGVPVEEYDHGDE